jgi:hypothetical protein
MSSPSSRFRGKRFLKITVFRSEVIFPVFVGGVNSRYRGHGTLHVIFIRSVLNPAC